MQVVTFGESQVIEEDEDYIGTMFVQIQDGMEVNASKIKEETIVIKQSNVPESLAIVTIQTSNLKRMTHQTATSLTTLKRN